MMQTLMKKPYRVKSSVAMSGCVKPFLLQNNYDYFILLHLKAIHTPIYLLIELLSAILDANSRSKSAAKLSCSSLLLCL